MPRSAEKEATYQRNDAGQRRVRDLVVGPELYDKWTAAGGRYCYLDGGRAVTTEIQKIYGCDTMLQKTGCAATHWIEEKIVRSRPGPGEYDAIAVETISTGTPDRCTKGWIHYSAADFLVYVLCHEDGSALALVMRMARLRLVFWPSVLKFPEWISIEEDMSRCRIVPIKWIEKHVVINKYHLHPSPEGRAAIVSFNSERPQNAEQHAD